MRVEVRPIMLLRSPRYEIRGRCGRASLFLDLNKLVERTSLTSSRGFCLFSSAQPYKADQADAEKQERAGFGGPNNYELLSIRPLGSGVRISHPLTVK